MTPEALTPKQKQVLDLLEQGKKPPAIATKLKISRSGVYGHMRNLRKLGIGLPGERIDDHDLPPVAHPTANTNGLPDPLAALRAATELGTSRLEEIALEVEELRTRDNMLAAESVQVREQLERYTRAEKELVG
jgi:hypothetical protein